MTKLLANEIATHDPPDGYLTLEGGVPEVREMLAGRLR
jgi:hypothetical protein